MPLFCGCQLVGHEMAFFDLCIEGTKGAGKTTTIAGLTERLVRSGCEVITCAPFAEANRLAQSKGYASAKEMISASKSENQAEIAFILETMAQAKISALQKAAAQDQPVILIYDRGWMTVRPHLFGGRWYAEDRAASDTITKTWSDVLEAAPPTAFLHASYEVTKERRPVPDTLGGLDTDEKLRQDVEGRRTFAQTHSDKITFSFNSGEISQDQIITRLAKYICARVDRDCVPS